MLLCVARLCLREDLLKEKAIQSSFRGHHTVRRFPMSTVTITNEGLDFIRKLVSTLLCFNFMENFI